MGAYDSIQDPVQGQPISSSLFGAPVKAAIQDLDRRMSAYDASTGIGKAYSTSNQVLTTTTETASLTIPSFVFRAGYAYKVHIRTGLASATAGTTGWFRIRKTNAVGTLWADFFRYQAIGGNVVGVNAQLYLLRNDPADLTADVCLSVQSSVAAASALTLYAVANQPRFVVIEPCGFATDYAGMGYEVT